MAGSRKMSGGRRWWEAENENCLHAGEVLEDLENVL